MFEVETIVASLCKTRGFRRRNKTANEKRADGRDLLIDCYRHLNNEPNGQHYLDVKVNFYDLLPGLNKSKPLKPHQYMAFCRIEVGLVGTSEISLRDLLNDETTIDVNLRKQLISSVFVDSVDPVLQIFGGFETLRDHVHKQLDPKITFFGPGVSFEGKEPKTDWTEFLVPL